KQKGQAAFAEWTRKARKDAKIVWLDPSVEWRYDYGKDNPMMGMMDPEAGKSRVDLPAKLRAYVAKNPDDHTAALALGTLLQRQQIMTPPGPARDKLRDEIIKCFESGVQSAGDQQVFLQLAQLYRDAKKNDKALDQYKRVQRL